MRHYLKVGLIFIGALLLFTLFNQRGDESKGVKKKFGQPNKIEVLQEQEIKPDQNINQQQVTKPVAQETNLILVNNKTENFFKNIPRISEFKNNPLPEVHEMPKELHLAGQYLAEMREFFNSHHVKPEIEMSFYLKCSQNDDFFDSIRAICAARMSKKYFEATGKKISPLLFDKKIAALKEQVSL